MERNIRLSPSYFAKESSSQLNQDQESHPPQDDQDEEGDVNPSIVPESKETVAKKRESCITKSGNGMENRTIQGLSPCVVFLPPQKKGENPEEFNAKGEEEYVLD